MATQAFVTRGFEQAVRRHTVSAAERNSTLFAAQQRSRRGPTPEVLFSKHIDNTRLVKAPDPQRTREMRSFAIAMAFLFAFVMIYMGQHFSAIEYGYRIETAKQQLEQLHEQSRQLMLSEAQLANPERIDRMAKSLGLDAPLPGQVVRVELNPASDANNGPVLAQAAPVPVVVAR
jgi:cell division protein FtsL